MNILLVCSAGMSTSLLVTKMEEAARNKGIAAKIWAVSGDAAREHIEEADVLLLGPQVRYLLGAMQKLGAEKGVAVDVINTMHYGLMNGEAVLEAAVALCNS
ncbi:PTS sugar transporter subunit IIB [Ectobacillus sp. JY-23]|uniref:PTS sugar transporter subunit IIB n=1 Tax=Ectobacillus sp. JY-23 TaxID=2933872 RepID=UPI001FF4320D|nr:PTS sugar transporter subunit IIB [Ectobacillus sp. JY-23]UOY91006.1 PTS sugar transporter subunit IIB [Ectobacillus sp. JY-23]